MSSTLIHERVELARAGKNPTVICQMPSGWCVLGDHQYLRGYCLLLADPIVPTLNCLDQESRRTFLSDMAIIGDAILEVVDALLINYELLGNSDRALHAHIFPRYANEPDERRLFPPFIYHTLTDKICFDSERDRALIKQLERAILKRTVKHNK